MTLTNQHSETVIEAPESRGGTTTKVVSRSSSVTREPRCAGGYAVKVLKKLRTDQNLIYLASRLQNYSDLAELRVRSLRKALDEDDALAVTELAHGLADATARLGAIRMMKLCIGLQMLGRRNLLPKARELLCELEIEFDRFKQSLISAVG